MFHSSYEVLTTDRKARVQFPVFPVHLVLGRLARVVSWYDSVGVIISFSFKIKSPQESPVENCHPRLPLHTNFTEKIIFQLQAESRAWPAGSVTRASSPSTSCSTTPRSTSWRISPTSAKVLLQQTDQSYLSLLFQDCGRDLEPDHNPLFAGKCLICFAKDNPSSQPSPSPAPEAVSVAASLQQQNIFISRLAHLMNMSRSGIWTSALSFSWNVIQLSIQCFRNIISQYFSMGSMRSTRLLRSQA